MDVRYGQLTAFNIYRYRKLYPQLTGSVSDGEEVEVLGTPGERGDGQLLHLVVAELPQRQQSALAVTVFVSLVLVVAEIYDGRQPQQQAHVLSPAFLTRVLRLSRVVLAKLKLLKIFISPESIIR